MIFPITPENLNKAAQIIAKGGVVAFPTETVYGLGADAFNPKAVERIFQIKARPFHDPLIVHIHSIEQIRSIAEFDPKSPTGIWFKKATAFWPGPLSLILPRAQDLPKVVTAGLDTVAIRMPSHSVAKEFLIKCKCPLAAPSANPFSYVSPTTAQHVEEKLGSQVDMILDGGACQVGLESTVLSLTKERPQILRPGAITREDLEKTLGLVDLIKLSSKIESPGQLNEHYAPATPLALRGALAPEDFPEKVGFISFRGVERSSLEFPYCEVLVISQAADQQEIAAKLFAAIRELDRLHLDLIVIDSCSEEGLGQAIMDRLNRASIKV